MYIPKANEETRVPVMQGLIAAHPLAILVTLGAGGLVATHLPMVLEADGSEFGALKGHVSRANSQWKAPVAGVDALVIFSGHQHYISPSWYAAKAEDGRVVPTSNYAVVHAYGAMKLIQDKDWLLEHLESLTTVHESAFERPWKVSDAPAEYVQQLMNGIVGVEIPVRRLEGKWKLSQNRSERDRQGVVEGLTEMNTPESLAMGEMVKAV